MQSERLKKKDWSSVSIKVVLIEDYLEMISSIMYI